MSTVAEHAAPDLTREQARELTNRIADAASDLWELVKRAYVERAWAALDYASWDEYVEAEFGSTRFKLPREERSEVVVSLRDAGLSLRAIASVTGDSKSTVGNVIHDAEDAKEPEPPAEPEPIYIDAEVIEPEESEVSNSGHVTLGKDGKHYPQPPAPPKEKKKPKPKDITMLSVARPEPADVNVFAHGATIGFGDPDLGAAVVEDQVQWFAAGSYDDITPGQARFLGACLLAAADVCEGKS